MVGKSGILVLGAGEVGMAVIRSLAENPRTKLTVLPFYH
jgi:saccharopine dehydrogenase-like NADP-dependent oxidoreductase